MIQAIPKLSSQDERSPEELLYLYRLEETQLAGIRKLSGQLLPRIEEVLDLFYEWMAGHPDMMAFFESDEALLHVRQMQSLYWQTFTAAKVDEAYLADRWRIGQVHARIGLPVMLYMAAISMIYAELAGVSAHLIKDHGQSVELTKAMAALLHLDAGLICQAFVDRRDALLHEQTEAVLAMSTPVTEIWNGILLLPVIGLVDRKRSEDILNAALINIRNCKAREFILDISGVGALDAAVANDLISMSKATALMGCRTTISGISPAISRTMVQLGVDLDDVQATATMMDALGAAFERRGFALQKRSH